MKLICLIAVALLFAYHVRESNAGAEEFGDNPEETNLTESEVMDVRKEHLKLELRVSCACVEGLENRFPELYLIGQVLYYPDTNPNNTKAKEGERFQTKVVNEDEESADFGTVLIIKNETNPKKIGVYVEVWDKDVVYDDYLGSVTIRDTKLGVGYAEGFLKKKRSKFYPSYSPKLEPCPRPDNFYRCKGRTGDVTMHLI